MKPSTGKHTSRYETMQSPNSDQQIIPSIKVSYLERTVGSIRKMQIEFPCQANACVIEKLQRDLKFNKKKVKNYIKDCFEFLFSDDDSLK